LRVTKFLEGYLHDPFHFVSVISTERVNRSVLSQLAWQMLHKFPEPFGERQNYDFLTGGHFAREMARRIEIVPVIGW